MIRLYEYDTPENYRDFQNFLFSYPYGFGWNFPEDKVIIHKVAYRISSLQRFPDVNQVICLCSCGGDGSGGSGGGSGLSKITTDVSLHGEGTSSLPLGVQLSKKTGNRLEILSDGCYVGGEPVPYAAPTITLSSSLKAGEYSIGDSYTNVILTVTVTKGSEEISDVRLYYNSSQLLHVFNDVSTGSKTYQFSLQQAIDNTISFRASCSDGSTIYSNTLNYTFHLPVFAGVSDSMQLDAAGILAGELLKITSTGSFSHTYPRFNQEHIWVARSSDKEIKTIIDENGFPITAAFVKSNKSLTIGGQSYPYTLYMFDTKTTGNNYKITFNS